MAGDPSGTGGWSQVSAALKQLVATMPIGAFVVDFYCSSEKLIVEVDGSIHETQREADAIRQELLESLGLRVLRLTNDEIEQDLPAAVEKIRGMFSEN